MGVVAYLNENKLFDDIMIFLNSYSSKNTKKMFESHIREFFRLTRNKEIEFLNEADLNFRLNDILEYRSYLLRKGNSRLTINQKINTVKLLFENLKANKYNVDLNIFKSRNIKFKAQSNQYGVLTKEEVDQFIEEAKKERHLADEKYLLIKFAIRTSFRLKECLSVKWSDITEEDGVYVVRTIGKGGKLISNSFHKNFYEELLKIKKPNTDKIFSLSEKTVQRMMDRIKNKLGIEPERNIVFHSFRNYAANKEFEISKDIKRVSQQLNHSSIETSYKHYMKKTKDYTQTIGVLMDEDIDKDFINQVTLEQFRDFFKQGDYILQLKLKEFIDKNK